jgi:hypothetical protein
LICPLRFKDFAKRQSMWDLLFAGLRMRKDEDMGAAVIRWLVQVRIRRATHNEGATGTARDENEANCPLVSEFVF